MNTFAYYYLWFFLLLQVFSLLKAYAVLGTPDVSLRNRLLASFFHVGRAAVSVALALWLFRLHEREVISSLWIMFAAAAFLVTEMIIVWVVEHRLLGKPLPTLKEFVS